MQEGKPLKVAGVIPARYGSSRFPGKPLALILGKSLIQRTYESCQKCSLLSDIVVATDDQRIFDHVQSFGGRVVMTDTHCSTGTDRIIQAVEKDPKLQDASILVNIQGDEPCIDPLVIQKVIELLIQDTQSMMSTAIMKLHSEEEAVHPSVVKCTVDKEGYALYFSRSLIPSNPNQKFNPSTTTYYKHIGIYGYRRDFLLQYGKLERTPLQNSEDLEQLKVLEHGFRIKTAVVDSTSVSVDHPEDIKKVELYLCKQNIYS